MLRLPMSRREFLRDYWQQRPLLIRQGLAGFRSPLSPEELAGLAMEADTESRIIGYRAGAWSLQHGPFDTQDFQRNDPWTLLVQRVDHWVPEVAALRQSVAFLPNWRFDDVMVSYAVDGGSVGPHFDRYDVFLLQGLGRRRWHLGQFCDEQTPRLQHEALHLLETFENSAEFVLEPGDVLYVPPGLAHWGVAEGECMTYSLGFRAPPLGDVMARLTDSVLDALAPQLLLEDGASLDERDRPGEITERHRTNARTAVINALSALDDGSALAEVVTEVNWDLEDYMPSPLLPGAVMLPAWARVAWIDQGAQCEVFANGARASFPASVIDLVTALCAGEALDSGELSEDGDELLDFLYGVGALVNTEDG